MSIPSAPQSARRRRLLARAATTTTTGVTDSRAVGEARGDVDVVSPGARRGPTADPHRLLRAWRPGRGSWFSGASGALLTHGTARVLADTSPDGVAEALRVARDDGLTPLAVGARPFDPAASGHLVVPRAVERADPLGAVLVDGADRPSVAATMRPRPDGPAYEAMVGEALRRMATGELEKVVLARALDLDTAEPVDAGPMLRELARRDPQRFLFGIDLPATGSGDRAPRTLIGASPELLLARRGDRVTANPLAGSAPRSDDPAEDARRGTDLLASAKNRHEHALVIDEVAAALRPLCRDLVVPAEPTLLRTATLWHLSTTVTGRVVDPATTSLHLAAALHPTPAVGGVPRAGAAAAIREIEPFDRGFYTGMVGWADADGDGEWVVALRCGEVSGCGVRLYAGAGIVPASVPAEELTETAVKLRTLLDALGLDEST